MDYTYKILTFIYSELIKFENVGKNKGTAMSKNNIDNIKGIINNKINIHHSHINNEIIGYAHSFCNARVRENKTEFTLFAHNLFRFDFFSSAERIKAGVWRTKDICIGGKNPASISFAGIGNQVMFLDTIKYFQQGLTSLANSLTDNEKKSIQKECKKFTSKDESLLRKFKKCTEDEQEWIINYLSSGKDVIRMK